MEMNLAFQMMLLLVMCLAIPNCATHLHPIGTLFLHSHRCLHIHARIAATWHTVNLRLCYVV